VGLLLVLVVDVADQNVVAGAKIDGQARRVADRDVLDLVDHLHPLALLLDGALLVGGHLARHVLLVSIAPLPFDGLPATMCGTKL
jgi:hypothetical protein